MIEYVILRIGNILEVKKPMCLDVIVELDHLWRLHLGVALNVACTEPCGCTKRATKYT